MVQIKRIQICGESKLLFETALKEEKFPYIWKIANSVPVHKNEEKNLLKNYRPISLLTIFSNIFERVILNSLFNRFVSNKLFTLSQAGLLIIHEMQTNFDDNEDDDELFLWYG